MTSEEGYLIQEYNSLRNSDFCTCFSVFTDFKNLEFDEQENIIESLTRFYNRYKDCDLLKKLYQIRAANSIKNYFSNLDSPFDYFEDKYIKECTYHLNAIGFD